MKTFAYFRAETPEQATLIAIEQLENAQDISFAQEPVKYIAGGTNLLDLMKLQVETPSSLVDISRLDLNQIETTPDGGLKIGAMVSNSDLSANPLVKKNYAVLSKALLAGASGQLRNKASTAGNLLQRTRCFYFYAKDSPCNKRMPGSGCPAIEGRNRMHAILGVSEHCIAQHPSDMAVAMQLLDASVQTLNADSTVRHIALADFYLLPADHPERETVLAQGELITHVILPPAPTGKQDYRKVRDRASYAFALVSIASVIDATAQQINSVQLAFGGIGARPWRDKAVEKLLCSRPASPELFNQAADLLLKDAKPSGENDFKIELTRRLFIAQLNDACKGAVS